MGNNQSNGRQSNWKIFKITKKSKHESFIRFYLDDYVTYNDGNYKHFDFDKNRWQTFWSNGDYGFLGDVGSYVKIDLSKTSEHSSKHSFESEEFAIYLVNGKVVERINENGDIVRDLLGGISSVGEVIEERQKHLAWVEYGRHANNHAWTKQTSWDMPPGWK